MKNTPAAASNEKQRYPLLFKWLILAIATTALTLITLGCLPWTFFKTLYYEFLELRLRYLAKRRQSDVCKYTHARESAANTSKPCFVCMENILMLDEVRWLECSHTFHLDCIDEWTNRFFFLVPSAGRQSCSTSLTRRRLSRLQKRSINAVYFNALRWSTGILCLGGASAARAICEIRLHLNSAKNKVPFLLLLLLLLLYRLFALFFLFHQSVLFVQLFTEALARQLIHSLVV